MIVAVAVAYVQALGGGFLWDDRLLITGVPLVEHGAPLGEYLRHPFWMGGAGPLSTNYYRPLVTLSFALDHRLHGENPAGYHLTNLLFHELNALLVLALLKRFGVRPLVAALLACAWALLPRLAEAAAWVSGRTDLLATAGVLGALVVWGPSFPRRLFASVLVAAGFLAKESALAAVVALAVYEWVRRREEPARKRLRSVALALLPVALAVLVYVCLRASAVGLNTSGHALSASRRVATVFDTITTYALMLVDAWRPRALIGRVGVVRPWGVAVGLLIVAGCGLLLFRARRRWSAAAAVGLALAFAGILPVLHLVPIPIRVIAADRFLYLPSAGLTIALGPRLDAWLALRRPAWLAAAALVVALGVGASLRVGIWSDELEFWVQTYLETPRTNCSAATNLVGVFFRAGQYRDALALSERELGYDDPEKEEARFNAALCLSRLGRKHDAFEQWRVLDATPHKPDVDVQIAIMELQTGQAEPARARLVPLARAGNEAARAILKQFPEFSSARAALAAAPADDAPERARLATFLGEEAIAVPAWLKTVSDPNVSRGTLQAALSYLVQTGQEDAIASVARRYIARFGPLDARIASIVSVRLDEIERVRSERARLGLAP